MISGTTVPPDLILHGGRITTLDINAGQRRGRRQGASPLSATTRTCSPLGDKTHSRRSAKAKRHPGPERLAPAPDPRRAQLQPGAALGRRAVARRRPADAQGAGRAHAAAAVGPRRRRLDRVPVRRAADADARRDQRRRPRHAGLRPAPLRPGAAQQGGAAGLSATRRTRPTRPAARSSATSGATRPACSSPGPTPRSSTPRWPRGRSCRPSTRSTRPGTSCAS